MLEKGSSLRGRRAWNRLLRAVGTGPSCQSSKTVWTTLTDIRFELWMVLCRARSRPPVGPFQLKILYDSKMNLILYLSEEKPYQI